MPFSKQPNVQQQKSTIRENGMIGVREALYGVQLRHEAIVKPWKKAKDKPEFKGKIERKHRLIIGTVKVIGQRAEKAAITVWQLLEHGTRIRFMDVSPDWISKTAPGRLSSGTGRGEKEGLNFKDANYGIVARDWKENVAKAQETAVDESVREGWKKGFQKGIGKKR